MVFHAIFDGGVDLGIFRGNAEHACEPHPEHRTRAARDNSRRHADDGTRADSARKRRHQRAELAYIAFAVFVVDHGHLDCFGQFPLNEARTDGQEDVRSQQEANHQRTPYNGIDLIKNADNIHAFPPSPFLR